MKKDFLGCSDKGGVYQIRNTKTGEKYIGSTVFFKQRAYQHQNNLRKNKHKNKHLQASWNKYGEQMFVFEIVEIVDGDKTKRTNIEQNYINNMLFNWNKCYNQAKQAERMQGPWSSNPEETREKLSKINKKRWLEDQDFRKKLSKTQFQKGQKPWIKGKNHTKEANEKNRLAHMGKKQSVKTKEKRSKALQGRVFSQKHLENLRKQQVFHLENDTIGYVFRSQAEAVEYLKLNRAHLSALLAGKRKTHKGFKVVPIVTNGK